MDTYEKKYNEALEREEELKKAVHQVSEEIVKEIFPDDLESGDFFTEIDLKNCITRVAYQFADWGAEHTPLPEDTVLFNKGVAEGKRLMMEDAVKWLVDDDYHEASERGRFILGSVGIGYNGYYIPYGDLLKLPKEDEK